MLLWTVERSVVDGGQTKWTGPGHAGHADSENAGTGTDARLRDRHAHRANQQRRVSGESGFALSGIPPARAGGLAEERMAGYREQPPREVLRSDGAGPEATQG